MRSALSAALGLVLILAGVSLAADKPADKPAANPNEKRKLLANHETIAIFKSIAFQKCRGLTALCPDNCGHSGDFANFDIVGYTKYDKADEYGDPKSDTFSFQIQDNHKNLKVTKELAAVANALKPGDYVRLTWHHDYVTLTEPGGSSSFPDRPIIKLEKITKEEGEKALKDAAGK
jgi:hypothetical protein